MKRNENVCKKKCENVRSKKTLKHNCPCSMQLSIDDVPEICNYKFEHEISNNKKETK